jgi:enamine deaminase RidA (YjgF/YER057c/UK114 family)
VSSFQLPWAVGLDFAEDYAAFKRLRPELLRAPFPASTGVVVGMLIPGMLVEIEAIAVRGPGRERDESPPP